MKGEQWLIDRVAYIKGLKKPTAAQLMLVALAEQQDKTKDDLKTLGILVTAEKAAVRAQEANKEVAAFLASKQKSEKEAARKARNHNLITAGALLISAGFVDSKTGELTIDKAELLGALIGLSKLPPEHERRGDWRRIGNEKLRELAATKGEE